MMLKRHSCKKNHVVSTLTQAAALKEAHNICVTINNS